jgi:predicted DNA binding CopG/RHH family protein
MKNIIIFLTFFLFSFNSFSQEIDYPIIQVDSLGKTVITMTIEQAQVLDNKADLLDLLEKANSQMINVDSVCVRIVNEKEEVIIKQDLKINELNNLVNNKDEQIENLQRRITDYQLKEVLFKMEIENKDKEINLHLGEIKRVKRKSLVGGITGGAIIVTLVSFLLIK